jgi:CTP-dependent riboflavin kinase
MAGRYTIPGKILSGAGQGAYFTQLEWVRAQCLEKVGFAPWPGTLNLEIQMEHVAVIEEMRLKNGIELISPDDNFCSGYVMPAAVEGVSAAIVVPAEDVRVHKKNVIEIIAPQRLKETMGVKDGDTITITIRSPYT